MASTPAAFTAVVVVIGVSTLGAVAGALLLIARFCSPDCRLWPQTTPAPIDTPRNVLANV